MKQGMLGKTDMDNIITSLCDMVVTIPGQDEGSES